MTTTALRQRQAALVLANQVRLRKQRLKRELHDLGHGDAILLAASLLESDDALIPRFKLSELLLAIPGLGPIKARMLARHIGVVAIDRRLCDLTVRQRDDSAVALRSRFWRRTA